MGSFLVFDLPPGVILGVDGHTWTTGRNFCGFRGLSEGLHWVYYAREVLHGFSQGFFFLMGFSEQKVFRYKEDREMLLEEGGGEIGFGLEDPRLILFPAAACAEGVLGPQQGAEERLCSEKTHIAGQIALFPKLISLITCKMLNEALPPCWHVTSATSSYLDEVLPGLPDVETEPAMQLLRVELRRTWRSGAVGLEVTEGFFDKSWELQRIIDDVTQFLYCPDDVFMDIFQDNGSLRTILRNLGLNISEIETPEESIENVKRAFMRLSSVLKQRFHLDIQIRSKPHSRSMFLMYDLEKDELVDTSESDFSDNDDSEDDPVVVQL
ncbi:hypothetical protein PORY_000640 [Pneumocystis oryctolagi]|uniref:Uncharacterized protein n=1 Tax=Pneumocystis oryctolagi TaxID=42067 RepID=A0ACB7CED0_9ASCO|nr:hypothetical protein PORY_000640 [Pneumocystis oryctolagi]